MSVRYRDFYNQFLKQDLMYLTYHHTKHVDDQHIDPKPLPPKIKRLPPFNNRMGPVIIKPKIEDPSLYSWGVKFIPELKKLSITTIVKEAIEHKSVLIGAFMALQCITGHHPKTIFARKNNGQLSLRKGMPIGCKVVLEGEDMYHFYEKLVEVVLPKMREFNGFTSVGDGKGSISIGLVPEALSYFPDIDPIYEKFPRMFGLNIAITTTAENTSEAQTLLSGFQTPISYQKNKDEQL